MKKQTIAVVLFAAFLGYAAFDFLFVDTGLLEIMKAQASAGEPALYPTAETTYYVPAESIIVPQHAQPPQAAPQPIPLAQPQAAPFAAPMATPLPLPTAPPAVVEIIPDVYAPSYEEQQPYQADYSDYVDAGEADTTYTEEYTTEYYDNKTFTTSDDVVLSLADAEFLLSCIEKEQNGRRRSPACPIKGRETENNPLGLSAAEILGTGR